MLAANGFEPIFNHLRFGSKADLALALRYVGFVPQADIERIGWGGANSHFLGVSFAPRG